MSDIKLYNGDCLEVMKEIQDSSVDMILTDPPYRVTSRGNAGSSGGMLQKKINKDGKVFEFNNVNIDDYAKEYYRVLKDGSHCYIMTNHTNLINMLNIFTGNGFYFVKSLIWDKGNKIMGQYYMSQFEYILFFRKGYGKKINKCGTPDLLSVPNKKTKGEDGKNLHDTEKPTYLMEILIENSSKVGDTVMDSFMGIGSTGVACINTNRNFIGIELDKGYFEIAQKRIEQAQGQFNG